MSRKKSFKKKWRDLQWPFIGGAALVTLVLGFIGFSKYFIALGDRRPFSNILYLTIQLLDLESGSVPGPVSWELDLARFLAPLIVASAAIKGLALIFRAQIQMLQVRFLAKHTIICGLGNKGMRLVRQFRQRNDRVVVIEKDAENEFLDKGRELGAIVLIGDAADPEMLRRARCHRAAYLISVCGSDGVNAEVAVHARRLAPTNRAKVLTCSVHIVDPRLCNLLKEKEMEAEPTDAFRLEYFDVFDVGARFWLNEHPPFSQEGSDVPLRPHLLLIAVGRLGESLLVQVARKWDASPHTPGEKLGLTIIDRLAESKKEYLCLRYPSLEKSCDLAALQMDIESPQFERADFLFGNNGRSDVTSIFVCLDNDSLGLSAALSLRRRLKRSRVPIVIRMSHEEGISMLLQEDSARDENQAALHSFDLLDRICLVDLALGGTKEVLAQAMHEDYVLEQRKIGQTPETNPALVSWGNLPESLKESNRSQADHIGTKLRAIGCGIEVSTDWREPLIVFSNVQIELMARMEHDRWAQERLRGGWRSGAKNIQKQRTPYLVPWEELAEDIKERDRAFVRDLPRFLAGVGFKIRRIREGPPE
jgi:hypothetical protein